MIAPKGKETIMPESPSGKTLFCALAVGVLVVMGARCPTNNTGAETPPVNADTTEIPEADIQEVQILPMPKRADICSTGRFDVHVVVKFKLSAANVTDGYVRVRLVDDDSLPPGDQVMGSRVFTVPGGLRAGDLQTVHTNFPLTCAQDCDVTGAEDSGEDIPTLEVETASGGDNYGVGSRATTGGDPSDWPGAQIACLADEVTVWDWIRGERQ